MDLVIHMLAHVVTRHARPLGTSFLAVWLILPGQAPDPGPFGVFIFAHAKIQLLTGSKETAKTNGRHTPPAPPGISRKRNIPDN